MFKWFRKIETPDEEFERTGRREYRIIKDRYGHYSAQKRVNWEPVGRWGDRPYSREYDDVNSAAWETVITYGTESHVPARNSHYKDIKDAEKAATKYAQQAHANWKKAQEAVVVKMLGKLP